MAVNIKEIQSIITEQFEEDINNDLILVQLTQIFILDGLGDAMDSLTGTEDDFFEIDINGEITPKL